MTTPFFLFAGRRPRGTVRSAVGFAVHPRTWRSIECCSKNEEGGAERDLPVALLHEFQPFAKTAPLLNHVFNLGLKIGIIGPSIHILSQFSW